MTPVADKQAPRASGLARRLHHALRGLGQLLLVLSIVTGGLAGPAAAGHQLLHVDERAAVDPAQLPHAHHAESATAAVDSPAADDQGCQPGPHCVAGCAQAGLALPPLRPPAAVALPPALLLATAADDFRSRSPERLLRPPIPPLLA